MLTGVYRYPPMDTVAFGEPWQEALPREMERLGASRAFVLASNSLAAAASLTAELRSILGHKLAGFATGIRAHTPRDDVVAAAAKAREANADVVVTMGGGSVTDAGKMVLLCLTVEAREPAALDDYRAAAAAGAARQIGRAHDRRPDDAVGRRVHLDGRLHRSAGGPSRNPSRMPR